MMNINRDVLPSNVKPIHYKLDIRKLVFDGFQFEGSVEIHVEFQHGTKHIQLHSKELSLKHGGHVNVESTNKKITIEDISYDKKSEVATLNLSEILPNSGNGTLVLNYEGSLNQEMAGFYRSAYKNSAGIDDWMYSTQFESCDARRAFPCFDEPNLKASFDFSIEVPETYTALSNQPVKSSEGLGNGLKLVTFETAPKMSTYLYAWACGDFEYIEAFTEREYPGRGRLPIRVYTTNGIVEQGRFALENARKIVDYFSEIFDIDYPLPKVDLLAVHEFVLYAPFFYFDNRIRCEQQLRSFSMRRPLTQDIRIGLHTVGNPHSHITSILIGLVVAHELAHQWFGNLVTMDWWSELWLNEGFATWVGWLATDHFHPAWDVWGQFVTEGLQTAFQLDGLRGSHPIEVPVKNALEIDQIFDHISYLKGSATIRMLSNFLGIDIFLRGVSNYLKAHAYGNATTDDLWLALGSAAGVDVASFMQNWIKVIGFPYLDVFEQSNQITIKQSRFLSTGDVTAEEDNTTWWIPLMLTDRSCASSAEKIVALTSKEITIKHIDTTHYKFNNGQTGFYRVNYPAERLLKLGKARDRLSVSDKVGIITDAAAMAFAGHGKTVGLLDFLSGLKDETNYFVWAGITTELGKLRRIFAQVGSELDDSLRKFTLDLVTPLVERLGWDFAPEEDWLVGRLRALIISTAGLHGHKGLITEAKRCFKLYTSGGDTAAIHPNLRLAVFRISMAEGGQEEYDAIMKEYSLTTTVDGREICLMSLGSARNDQIISQVLNLILSEEVKAQDKHTPAISLSNNNKARHKLWEFIRANWPSVYAQMSGNMVVLDRFLKNSLNKFAQESDMNDIQIFFEQKDNTGYDKGLNVIYDSIRGNANYANREKDTIEDWLKSHGY